jgi:16S rRNA (cytidine1402-2'-O)-methyltransferase
MIAEFAAVKASLIFYESGPRLAATLSALLQTLGNREAAVAREISKAYEETVTGTLENLAGRYADTAPKGEIVIIVAPPSEAPLAPASAADAMLAEALIRLPAAKAAAEVSRATGLPRAMLYDRAVQMKNSREKG